MKSGEIREYFCRAKKSGKLSHAYILEDESGREATELAQWFAALLECENGSACGTCSACRACAGGNHPDVLRISHEKPDSIGVDEIRAQLVDDILIRPYSGPYKVYLVPEAEKLTVQAQNALLKTLEEPPSYGVILLLTANGDKLLPTIRSRGILLKLTEEEQTELAEFFETQIQSVQENYLDYDPDNPEAYEGDLNEDTEALFTGLLGMSIDEYKTSYTREFKLQKLYESVTGEAPLSQLYGLRGRIMRSALLRGLLASPAVHLPVQTAGLRLAHRLLNGEHLHRDGADAEAQGDLISHLHVVAGPGGLAVDGHKTVVAGLVGHGPALDEPGHLQIFVQTHMVSSKAGLPALSCRQSPDRFHGSQPQARPAAACGRLASCLLRHGVLERLAGLEHRHHGSRDLNGLLGLGVAADAGGALFHLEGAKAHQLDLVAFLQGSGDGVQSSGDDSLGFLLGDLGGSSDRVDEFSLVHG